MKCDFKTNLEVKIEEYKHVIKDYEKSDFCKYVVKFIKEQRMMEEFENKIKHDGIEEKSGVGEDFKGNFTFCRSSD